MTKSRKNQNFAPFFLLFILPLLAVLISSYAIYKGLQNYIATSNYFKVRELKVEGITDLKYLDVIKEQLLGVNIFRVKSERLAERIQDKFPNFTSVTVIRILPSQLRIVAKERIPLAVIRQDLCYIFDGEGVALSSFSPAMAAYDLPLIVGLENKLQKIRVGAAYQFSTLHKALLLAGALRAKKTDINAAFSKNENCKVTKIDAIDPGNLSFYLGDDIQVKVGDKDFQEKLNFLPDILRSISGDLSNIRYIDLRPKEPVVATKNNKPH
jgi:cell division septal protein FtsQ